MIKQNERSPQILVVEDDLEFNEVLCRALIRRGYGVSSASNGRDGLHMYKNNPADLVITDILMPEQDGVELIIDLKKCFPNVKILAISGGGEVGSGQRYLRSTRLICNIEHTLAKPFARDELFLKIQEVLKE